MIISVLVISDFQENFPFFFPFFSVLLYNFIHSELKWNLLDGKNIQKLFVKFPSVCKGSSIGDINTCPGPLPAFSPRPGPRTPMWMGQKGLLQHPPCPLAPSWVQEHALVFTNRGLMEDLNPECFFGFFCIRMQRWFNICKSITVIYYIIRNKNQCYLFITIETEKAFEKIQHPLMIKTWKQYIQKDLSSLLFCTRSVSLFLTIYLLCCCFFIFLER